MFRRRHPRHRAHPEDTALAERRVRALRRPSPPLRVGGWVPRRDASAMTGSRATGQPTEVETRRPEEPMEVGAREPEGKLFGRPGEALAAAWGLRRGHVVVVAGLLLLAVIGAGVMVLRARPVREGAPPTPAATVAAGRPVTSPAASAQASSSPSTLVVHVAGKVRKPGVVHLQSGARVIDAVSASGGALAGVDLGTLNLARPLADGEQVLVGITPPPGAVPPDAAGPGSPQAAGASAGALLDLNTATLAQLEELPGVGPVLAQRISDFRSDHGRFTSVDELREVTGIGERKFSDLRPRVTVR
ncbi:ComEA family DNA-binding protein [Actinopolymorpha alba]|uniref:ComEA family DNA-binding protein n=1 Tax=Actinopolymorpha alba TaxID=533267 RepID=UPI000477A0B7|nr:ComEA family DNA-binding protein [Actinopolymorpha alba]